MAGRAAAPMRGTPACSTAACQRAERRRAVGTPSRRWLSWVGARVTRGHASARVLLLLRTRGKRPRGEAVRSGTAASLPASYAVPTLRRLRHSTRTRRPIAIQVN
jgi:hypothetical protein